uniref:Uncharacterized protein n=1 Tax=Opuntia streptacantha TaxID=393608 RepID=A0A7C9EIX4_OPUST
MVAASASEREASPTFLRISCLKALFSLCLKPSPTSNCTANLATQLANGYFSKYLSLSPLCLPCSLSPTSGSLSPLFSSSSSSHLPTSIKSPPSSDLCMPTNFCINSSLIIASIASFRPKYPISRTQSKARTRIAKSSELRNLIMERISSFDSISSTNGLLIDLIREQSTSRDEMEAIEIRDLIVGPINT